MLEDYFNEISSAFWFMDDGNSSKYAYSLSTHSFSLEDNIFLSDFFKRKFNINAKVYKDGDYYRIYIPAADCLKFKDIIIKYIIPCKMYKLN